MLFTQFTATLIESILAPYYALSYYVAELDKSKYKAAREEFLSIWTDKDTMYCCEVLHDVLSTYF